MITYKFNKFYENEKHYSYNETEIGYNYLISNEDKKIYFACTALIDPRVEEIRFGDAEDGNEVIYSEDYNPERDIDLSDWVLFDENENEISLKQASEILNCSEEELNETITKVKEDSRKVLDEDLAQNLDYYADPDKFCGSYHDGEYDNSDEEYEINRDITNAMKEEMGLL